ncbi:F0F1 ATP synthase subunit delta [Solimonas terrae]|uniref:ATP synthase subunit delta n=1 Tax=Solimonas terrae TaxID=1396819 RepID=A0A6M2BSR4_9GAMM|nr:F0F1 ATP synthase subunit delta [Solimonas terrae]NGY05636.1 F0F1 ATP synthase subunit delta [Solimonas terrae]
MADFSTTAHPYAKAVFELARESGDYKAWNDSLRAVAGLLGDRNVAALAANPALTRGDLADVLAGALSGKVAHEAVSLVRLLVENGRLNAIAAVAEQFEALRAEAERRVEVEIVSAVPVEAAQQDKLAAAVKQRLTRDVAISWKTDASLIGGAVIRAGDLVIDGSVSGELERLKTAVAR